MSRSSSVTSTTFVQHAPQSAPTSRNTRPTAAEVAASASKPGRNYPCAECGKSFTTSGHLARHTKTHTGERSHKCPFPGCNTACSRQDNLQQHYRVHLSPGSKRASHAENRASMREQGVILDVELDGPSKKRRRRNGPSAAGAVFYTTTSPAPDSPPMTPPPLAEADIEVLTGMRPPRALPDGTRPTPIYNALALDCNGYPCPPQHAGYRNYAPHAEPAVEPYSPASSVEYDMPAAQLSPLAMRACTPGSRISGAPSSATQPQYTTLDNGYPFPSERVRASSSSTSSSVSWPSATPHVDDFPSALPMRLAGPGCPPYTPPPTAAAPREQLRHTGLPGMGALVASLRPLSPPPSRSASMAPLSAAASPAHHASHAGLSRPRMDAVSSASQIGPFPGGGVPLTAAYRRSPDAPPAPAFAAERPTLPFPALAITSAPSPSRVLPPLPPLSDMPRRGLQDLARVM